MQIACIFITTVISLNTSGIWLKCTVKYSKFSPKSKFIFDVVILPDVKDVSDYQTNQFFGQPKKKNILVKLNQTLKG